MKPPLLFNPPELHATVVHDSVDRIQRVRRHAELHVGLNAELNAGLTWLGQATTGKLSPQKRRTRA